MQYAKTDFNENPIPSIGLEQPVLPSKKFSLETILFIVILILAVISRFSALEPRVMSHDENSHVYFSWFFYKGDGYSHDPVTHGPFQFHVVALSYFLFGPSDTSARIPAAVFSVATIAFIWCFRRYIGRAGALIAALLFTISPYMLFYGRYVRNEAFVALFGVVTIWAILRYLETGQNRFLYWLTAVMVLHFATKETSFIYAAQALLFLGLYFVYRITQKQWRKPEQRLFFLLSLIVAIVIFSFGILLRSLSQQIGTSGEAIYPKIAALPQSLPLIVVGIAIIFLVAAIYFILSGYTLALVRQERSFDLVILLGTLVLPQLSAFLINFAGWTVPVNAAEVNALTLTDIIHMALIIVPMLAISIGVGLWWKSSVWLINAGIWYSIFTVLYTSLFTNGAGFFTGLVGSLGYWLEQQAVNRGDQPFYYYALVQIPIYEYLPAFGCLLALIYGVLKGFRADPTAISPEHEALATQDDGAPNGLSDLQKPPTTALLGFWVFTSLLAFSIAGEKMPWLTVHITLPMILLSGWFFGYIIDSFDWSAFKNNKGWLSVAILAILIPAIASALHSLLGDNPPFAGNSLDQLASTAEFLIAVIAVIGCSIGLYLVIKSWLGKQVRRLLIIMSFIILALLTFRTAFAASYINFDRATEFLVYAHSGPGVKIALEQIEQISKRLTAGLDLEIRYDNETSYPYWWYFRDYPNAECFNCNGREPTRELRNIPVILAGDLNYGKLAPIVGDAYYQFDFIRIWWPIEDYDDLTWERISSTLGNPELREAIFRIWFYRDYKPYLQLTNRDPELQNWSPSGRMRLYIRKDIIAQLWDFGSGAAAAPVFSDPYENKQVARTADLIIGTQGSDPGQLNNPRDVAVAPDGSLYVADTLNHRIQHFSADGTILHVWGSFADQSKGDAPEGTFYEPWGVAIGPDGTVYVTDTWNHRIQHFTAEGEFISMWGFFGQAETPYALWGPRDIAINTQGQVFVTDTGNKRIVIYDADGAYITQFGSVGFELGQFDEPVGITIDNEGNVYIADTWNQRIQVMAPDESGGYKPLLSWDVDAWYGESLDNKPYLAVDPQGEMYVSDPEGYRIIHYSNTGAIIDYFGDYGISPNAFSIPNGLCIDAEGGLWIADSANHRVMHFPLDTTEPQSREIAPQ